MNVFVRAVELIALAAVGVGLWLIDPWWLLVVAGLVGLVSVDRAEHS
jgi:hypothetical protein